MRMTALMVGPLLACTSAAGEVADEPAPARADASTPGDAGADPLAWLDPLALVLVLGDSLAAGYNAPGENDEGGQGYARLLVDNHPAFPDHLPTEVGGHVVVLMNVGGNDFNDDLETMIFSLVAEQRAARLRANLAEMIRLLRERYHDPQAGKQVVFLVNNIHDPTDGTGEVPAEFDDGFCNTIHQVPAPIRTLALENHELFNRELEAEVAAQGARLVDIHRALLAHGMNAGPDRLIDGDCAHPTGPGHDLVRRTAWEALTGSP